MTKDEVDLLRARLYALLAALLLEPPDEEMLAQLRKIKGASNPNGILAQAIDNLARAAEEIKPSALEQEFYDLFIGITRGELLPYGSWYLTGYLNETPLARLRDDIHVLGLKRNLDRAETEDHVAAIFEALALLVGEGDKRQRELFEKHLAPWAGQFFNELANSRIARFYRAVADLGRAFLEMEVRYFGLG